MHTFAAAGRPVRLSCFIARTAEPRIAGSSASSEQAIIGLLPTCLGRPSAYPPPLP